ncbi:MULTISPECIES: DUF2889 domain-containing protein [Oligella]|uniref:Protein of uncharacterized function (DUF2889) n=1 Tax=Oligella urethralis TaxID=90245 RepID=A0A2X1VJQ9_9BURK|nr:MULTISPECIES: DUF2889 domain-containing protein [Oligella]SPY08630.1 Protein of uncharacterised function (DUF2889) [Oligella urethralis]
MVERKKIHTRQMSIESYERSDGLWDIEAKLVDFKSYDFTKSDGSIKKAGDPVHDLNICLTVNDEGLIVDAGVSYAAAPYGDVCRAIEESYQRLIGLHLLKGFRHKVREQFAKTQGCTHMSELAVLIPTVFVQSLSRKRINDAVDSGRRPFQLEGCHAYALGSPVVKEFYPQWYVPTVD